jgi:NADPH-dependent curcumin reductase CurA
MVSQKLADSGRLSGAAGAVGGLVGQVHKTKGCRVVGIASGAEKCKFLKMDGFDAVDYKMRMSKKGLKASHKRCRWLADNVGGDILNDIHPSICALRIVIAVRLI